MTQADPTAPPHLVTAVVLRVGEDACEVRRDGRTWSVPYAPAFPSPRAERVSPGHLVAVATGTGGQERVVWRWYDAVVLGRAADAAAVRLWEPAHGEAFAAARDLGLHLEPGTRAYASAGLPGADWWVVGPVADPGASLTAELEAVDRLYADNGLWEAVFASS
jgi:hypothetical protein